MQTGVSNGDVSDGLRNGPEVSLGTVPDEALEEQSNDRRQPHKRGRAYDHLEFDFKHDFLRC